MRLWIVGKFTGDGYHDAGGKWHGNLAWEFQGVFDSEERAIAACTSDIYFIGPAMLNATIPDETVPWLGCYYPRLEDRPECHSQCT